MRTMIYLGIPVSGGVIFLAVDDIAGRESFKNIFKKMKKTLVRRNLFLNSPRQT